MGMSNINPQLKEYLEKKQAWYPDNLVVTGKTLTPKLGLGIIEVERQIKSMMKNN